MPSAPRTCCTTFLRDEQHEKWAKTMIHHLPGKHHSSLAAATRPSDRSYTFRAPHMQAVSRSL
jgi:hypothetical protein